MQVIESLYLTYCNRSFKLQKQAAVAVVNPQSHSLCPKWTDPATEGNQSEDE